MVDKVVFWDSFDWYTKRVFRVGVYFFVSKFGVFEVRVFIVVFWRG